MMTDEDRAYLSRAFSDLLNYQAEDVTAPIDPLTYRSPEGDSCLHIAALRGDLRAVRLLLDHGLDPNMRGDMGNTPLHYAAQKGHEQVVTTLMQSGASTHLLNDFGRKPKGETI